MFLAALNDQKDVVELLLANGAKVNARADNGFTPLHYAGNRDVVASLLANKADVNARNNMGQTPLQFAVQSGHEDVANLLRQHGAK